MAAHSIASPPPVSPRFFLSSRPLMSPRLWVRSLALLAAPLMVCTGPLTPSLAQKKARTLGGSDVPLGLGDFFFSADDPLHPDREEDEEEE